MEGPDAGRFSHYFNVGTLQTYVLKEEIKKKHVGRFFEKERILRHESDTFQWFVIV